MTKAKKAKRSGINVEHYNKRMAVKTRLTMVARMKARGLSQDEILTALKKIAADEGMNLGEVNSEQYRKDVKEIENYWHSMMSKDIIEHKARQLAELAEVKRLSWLDSKYETIIKAISQEIIILGTKAEHKDHKNTGNNLEPKIIQTIDPVEASKIYQSIMRG